MGLTVYILLPDGECWEYGVGIHYFWVPRLLLLADVSSLRALETENSRKVSASFSTLSMSDCYEGKLHVISSNYINLLIITKRMI